MMLKCCSIQMRKVILKIPKGIKNNGFNNITILDSILQIEQRICRKFRM